MNLWYRDIRMTPERQAVASLMEAMDEGLGPRAARCLMQLADGVQPSAVDIDWLTDGVEEPAIARRNDWGKCEPTAYGRLLIAAIDRGDIEAVCALTTMPELLEGPAR